MRFLRLGILKCCGRVMREGCGPGRYHPPCPPQLIPVTIARSYARTIIPGMGREILDSIRIFDIPVFTLLLVGAVVLVTLSWTCDPRVTVSGALVNPSLGSPNWRCPPLGEDVWPLLRPEESTFAIAGGIGRGSRPTTTGPSLSRIRITT